MNTNQNSALALLKTAAGVTASIAVAMSPAIIQALILTGSH
jgi:hypothetical protein